MTRSGVALTLKVRETEGMGGTYPAPAGLTQSYAALAEGAFEPASDAPAPPVSEPPLSTVLPDLSPCFSVLGEKSLAVLRVSLVVGLTCFGGVLASASVPVAPSSESGLACRGGFF